MSDHDSKRTVRRFDSGRLEGLGGHASDRLRTPPPSPATPAAAPDAPDDDGFLTHAPGAIVAPIAAPPARRSGGLTSRLAATFGGAAKTGVRGLTARLAKGIAEARRPGGARALTGRLAASTGGAVARGLKKTTNAFGKEALARALAAQDAARRRPPPAPPREPDPASSEIFRPPEAPAPSPFATSFLLLLPGALAQPLTKGGAIAMLGGGALIAVAALLFELSPHLGLIASAFMLAQLAAVRVKVVRDASHGRDGVVWPSFEDSFGAVPQDAAALALFLPAIVLGIVAWGEPAWDRSNPHSIPSYARRLVAGAGERAVARDALSVVRPDRKPVEVASPGPDTAALPEEARIVVETTTAPPPSEGTKGALQAAVRRSATEMFEDMARGDAPPSESVAVPGEPGETARAVLADAHEQARRLFETAGTTTSGVAGRACLLVAFGLFPMSLLVVSRVESVYAAWSPSLLLRSIVRAPVAYAAVVAIFLGQAAVLGGAAFAVEPAAHAWLGRPLLAHVTAVFVLSALVVGVTTISGAALGRFYRSRANVLGW